MHREGALARGCDYATLLTGLLQEMLLAFNGDRPPVDVGDAMLGVLMSEKAARACLYMSERASTMLTVGGVATRRQHIADVRAKWVQMQTRWPIVAHFEYRVRNALRARNDQFDLLLEAADEFGSRSAIENTWSSLASAVCAGDYVPPPGTVGMFLLNVERYIQGIAPLAPEVNASYDEVTSVAQMRQTLEVLSDYGGTRRLAFVDVDVIANLCLQPASPKSGPSPRRSVRGRRPYDWSKDYCVGVGRGRVRVLGVGFLDVGGCVRSAG